MKTGKIHMYRLLAWLLVICIACGGSKVVSADSAAEWGEEGWSERKERVWSGQEDEEEEEKEEEDEGEEEEEEEEKEEEDEGEEEEEEEENDEDDDEDDEPVIVGRTIVLGTQGSAEVSVEYGEVVEFSLDLESESSIYAPWKGSISSVTYECDDDEIFRRRGEGVFQAVGLGKGNLTVRIYDLLGEECGVQSYTITTEKNMSKVSLEKTSFSAKTVIYSYDSFEFKTKVRGMEGIGEDTYGVSFQVSGSNSEMWVDTYFENGTIYFQTSSSGTTKLTILLNGKKFKVTLTVKEIRLSGSTSFYMTPKQSKKFSVKNLGSTKIQWSSSNTKVMSVNKSGKVKAKKTGTAVIMAKVNGHSFGCVISVITKARKKVVNRARYIGTHWSYSQSKRMQDKYYDCSSLVWKSYKLEGKRFGDRSYAPVAADIAKYCAKKRVKGNIEKNIQKAKYQPGALTFKTGSKNGRYLGIYHVEMFIGYTFEGVTGSGKAVLGTRWAARPDNYDYGEVWAQP